MMINNKVEELVEWVASLSYSKVVGGATLLQFRKLNKGTKTSHIEFANKILSHPDLVLIDAEKLITNLKLIATGTFKKKSDYPSIVECIIPLAEAIKELSKGEK